MPADWPPWLYELAHILVRLLPIVAFVAWCLWAIDWRKAWPILAAGGWVALVLIGGMAAAVWAFVFPAPHVLFGSVVVPNGLWHLAAVASLICLALFCGWLQGRLGWYPPEISFAQPPADAHDHGHDGHAPPVIISHPTH
jgi:hypothetical protein